MRTRLVAVTPLSLVTALLAALVAASAVFVDPAVADHGDKEKRTSTSKAPTELRANLTGASVVGIGGALHQGDPDGRGTVKLTLKGSRRFCYEVSVTTIVLLGNTVTLHKGLSNKTGKLVATLDPLKADGTSEGCMKIRKWPYKRMKKYPTRFYISVQNNALPGGALRGQLDRGT